MSLRCSDCLQGHASTVRRTASNRHEPGGLTRLPLGCDRVKDEINRLYLTLVAELSCHTLTLAPSLSLPQGRGVKWPSTTRAMATAGASRSRRMLGGCLRSRGG